jgi:hypothetical protein
MNNEFGRILKEAVVTCSGYHSLSFMEGLRKTTRNLIEDFGIPAEIETGNLLNRSLDD